MNTINRQTLLVVLIPMAILSCITIQGQTITLKQEKTGGYTDSRGWFTHSAYSNVRMHMPTGSIYSANSAYDFNIRTYDAPDVNPPPEPLLSSAFEQASLSFNASGELLTGFSTTSQQITAEEIIVTAANKGIYQITFSQGFVPAEFPNLLVACSSNAGNDESHSSHNVICFKSSEQSSIIVVTKNSASSANESIPFSVDIKWAKPSIDETE